MTKHNHKYRNFEIEDDYDDRNYRDEIRERRKLKRMKNALKSRRVDELLDIDDDY